MKDYTEPVIKVDGRDEFDELGRYCKKVGMGWFSFEFDSNYLKDDCVRLCKTPKHAKYSYYTEKGITVTDFKEISTNGKIDEDKLNRILILSKLENNK